MSLSIFKFLLIINQLSKYLIALQYDGDQQQNLLESLTVRKSNMQLKNLLEGTFALECDEGAEFMARTLI